MHSYRLFDGFIRVWCAVVCLFGRVCSIKIFLFLLCVIFVSGVICIFSLEGSNGYMFCRRYDYLLVLYFIITEIKFDVSYFNDNLQ